MEILLKIPFQKLDTETIWDIFQDSVNRVALRETSFHEETMEDHLSVKVKVSSSEIYNEEDLSLIIKEEIVNDFKRNNIKFSFLD